MDLLSSASSYLQETNDEYDSLPEKVGVSIAEYSDTYNYEISGRFPEEKEDDTAYIPKESVFVELNSDMENEIDAVFNSIRTNVTVNSPAEISSIHISHTVNDSVSREEWSGYTKNTADARVFIGIEQHSIPDEWYDQLLELVIDDLNDIDEDVTEEQIQSVEYLFSDLKECFLQSVRGKILTPSPHKYYSNVNSKEKFLEKARDDKITEIDGFSFCEVDFRLSESDSSPDEDIQNIAEDFMYEFVSNTLSTNWEYKLEAECISFGEFEYQSTDEFMKYYITVPIVGNDIGISKE